MAPTSHHFRFAPTLAGFEDAARTLRQLLDSRGIPTLPRHNVELAFEEVAVNVVRYGHPAHDIDVEVVIGEDTVDLTVEDDGQPFDPLQQPEPVVPESLDEAQVGGLGLVLVRKLSTRLDYARTAEDRNRLTVSMPLG